MASKSRKSTVKRAAATTRKRAPRQNSQKATAAGSARQSLPRDERAPLVAPQAERRPCGFELPGVGLCRQEAGHGGQHHIPLGDGLEALAWDSEGTYTTAAAVTE